ncbi:MAG: hypothetical protein Q7S13_03325, partial [Candidatus Omnitrophota bacterium]|nr:hypothetical protein [Candidatus Omnitrophota bacterium]
RGLANTGVMAALDSYEKKFTEGERAGINQQDRQKLLYARLGAFIIGTGLEGMVAAAMMDDKDINAYAEKLGNQAKEEAINNYNGDKNSAEAQEAGQIAKDAKEAEVLDGMGFLKLVGLVMHDELISAGGQMAGNLATMNGTIPLGVEPDGSPTPYEGEPATLEQIGSVYPTSLKNPIQIAAFMDSINEFQRSVGADPLRVKQLKDANKELKKQLKAQGLSNDEIDRQILLTNIAAFDSIDNVTNYIYDNLNGSLAGVLLNDNPFLKTADFVAGSRQLVLKKTDAGEVYAVNRNTAMVYEPNPDHPDQMGLNPEEVTMGTYLGSATWKNGGHPVLASVIHEKNYDKLNSRTSAGLPPDVRQALGLAPGEDKGFNIDGETTLAKNDLVTTDASGKKTYAFNGTTPVSLGFDHEEIDQDIAEGRAVSFDFGEIQTKDGKVISLTASRAAGPVSELTPGFNFTKEAFNVDANGQKTTGTRTAITTVAQQGVPQKSVDENDLAAVYRPSGKLLGVLVSPPTSLTQTIPLVAGPDGKPVAGNSQWDTGIDLSTAQSRDQVDQAVNGTSNLGLGHLAAAHQLIQNESGTSEATDNEIARDAENQALMGDQPITESVEAFRGLETLSPELQQVAKNLNMSEADFGKLVLAHGAMAIEIPGVGALNLMGDMAYSYNLSADPTGSGPITALLKYDSPVGLKQVSAVYQGVPLSDVRQGKGVTVTLDNPSQQEVGVVATEPEVVNLPAALVGMESMLATASFPAMLVAMNPTLAAINPKVMRVNPATGELMQWAQPKATVYTQYAHGQSIAQPGEQTAGESGPITVARREAIQDPLVSLPAALIGTEPMALAAANANQLPGNLNVNPLYQDKDGNLRVRTIHEAVAHIAAGDATFRQISPSQLAFWGTATGEVIDTTGNAERFIAQQGDSPLYDGADGKPQKQQIGLNNFSVSKTGVFWMGEKPGYHPGDSHRLINNRLFVVNGDLGTIEEFVPQGPIAAIDEHRGTFSVSTQEAALKEEPKARAAANQIFENSAALIGLQDAPATAALMAGMDQSRLPGLKTPKTMLDAVTNQIGEKQVVVKSAQGIEHLISRVETNQQNPNLPVDAYLPIDQAKAKRTLIAGVGNVTKGNVKVFNEEMALTSEAETTTGNVFYNADAARVVGLTNLLLTPKFRNTNNQVHGNTTSWAQTANKALTLLQPVPAVDLPAALIGNEQMVLAKANAIPPAATNQIAAHMTVIGNPASQGEIGGRLVNYLPVKTSEVAIYSRPFENGFHVQNGQPNASTAIDGLDFTIAKNALDQPLAYGFDEKTGDMMFKQEGGFSLIGGKEIPHDNTPGLRRRVTSIDPQTGEITVYTREGIDQGGSLALLAQGQFVSMPGNLVSEVNAQGDTEYSVATAQLNQLTEFNSVAGAPETKFFSTKSALGGYGLLPDPQGDGLDPLLGDNTKVYVRGQIDRIMGDDASGKKTVEGYVESGKPGAARTLAASVIGVETSQYIPWEVAGAGSSSSSTNPSSPANAAIKKFANDYPAEGEIKNTGDENYKQLIASGPGQRLIFGVGSPTQTGDLSLAGPLTPLHLSIVDSRYAFNGGEADPLLLARSNQSNAQTGVDSEYNKSIFEGALLVKNNNQGDPYLGIENGTTGRETLNISDQATAREVSDPNGQKNNVFMHKQNIGQFENDDLFDVSRAERVNLIFKGASFDQLAAEQRYGLIAPEDQGFMRAPQGV